MKRRTRKKLVFQFQIWTALAFLVEGKNCILNFFSFHPKSQKSIFIIVLISIRLEKTASCGRTAVYTIVQGECTYVQIGKAAEQKVETLLRNKNWIPISAPKLE